jgi:hypothetical protein
MMAVIDFRKPALSEDEARKIAAAIDPAAGGFFRSCLVRAAQMGAETALRRERQPDETPLPSPENSLP